MHPDKFNGGGELDNRMIIEAGRKLGHDIQVGARLHHKYWSRIWSPGMNLHRSPDLWILSDLFNVPEYKLRYKTGWLEKIIREEPYVHLDNAYVDICSKGALPCAGDWSHCLGACGYALSDPLYENSQLNVFLSPLHADTINSRFNNRHLHKTFIVRPLIDTERFYNKNVERDIDFLYVGTISNYKGYQTLKEEFGKEKNFLFIGKNATGEKLFGNHIEYIDNECLVDYFNRSKHFVHLPAWKEPMGRTVIEAALCGCKIIANTRVGACSFDFDIGDPENSKGAAAELWLKIKESTKK